MQFSLFDYCSFDSRRGNRVIEVYVNWKCIAERSLCMQENCGLLSLPNKSSSFRRDLLSRPTTLAFTFKIINRLTRSLSRKSRWTPSRVSHGWVRSTVSSATCHASFGADTLGHKLEHPHKSSADWELGKFSVRSQKNEEADKAASTWEARRAACFSS